MHPNSLTTRRVVNRRSHDGIACSALAWPPEQRDQIFRRRPAAPARPAGASPASRRNGAPATHIPLVGSGETTSAARRSGPLSPREQHDGTSEHRWQAPLGTADTIAISSLGGETQPAGGKGRSHHHAGWQHDVDHQQQHRRHRGQAPPDARRRRPCSDGYRLGSGCHATAGRAAVPPRRGTTGRRGPAGSPGL